MSTESMVEEMMAKSRKALKALNGYSQEQIDALCKAACLVIRENAEMLAREAIDETGMGKFEDKVGKNVLVADSIWNSIKHKKTVGIIEEDVEHCMTYIAQPKGVVISVLPCTNPSATVIANGAVALKGRNTVIFCPHPKAVKVGKHTMDLINAAMKKLGAPDDIFQMVESISVDITQAFMRAGDVIVATGGPGLVKVAYASGKPALGVGAGNVQAIIDRDADYKLAAEEIVGGRIMDNGILCSCNQSAIMPRDRAPEIIEFFRKAGAFYVGDPAEVDKFRKALFTDGKANPKLIGQSAQKIAEAVGVAVPAGTKAILLQCDDKKIGADDILCSEKMCPVLIAIPYDTLDHAIEICNTNLYLRGAGHTTCIFSNNQKTIRELALQIPVCRIVVNQDGINNIGIEFNNGMEPTATLGCGSWGGNSFDENLTCKHLINIVKVTQVIPGKTMPTLEQIYS